MEKITKGAKVLLKSNGLKMSVLSWESHDRVLCCWLDNSQEKKAYFHEDALDLQKNISGFRWNVFGWKEVVSVASFIFQIIFNFLYRTGEK